LTTARSIAEQGQKAARQRKIPPVRKSYSLYISPGNVAEGNNGVGEDDDE
jgi:hypothetical protein